MRLSEMGQRGCDAQGCGYYRASRGSRLHMGIDLCDPSGESLEVGTEVVSGLKGEVVKVGRAYGAEEKSHLRYIAIKLGVYYCRIFYVTPLVSVGDTIKPNDVIGLSQCLGEFYEGITEHVHFECYKLVDPLGGEHDKNNFSYVDPKLALEVMGGA